jgi:hypothetical protein
MDPIQVDRSDLVLIGDEDFIALVCADEELLRAEFDAIIRAEWPAPPSQRPDPASGETTSSRGWRGGETGDRQSWLPDRPGGPWLEGLARQRSPPARELSWVRNEVDRRQRQVMTSSR